MQQVGWWNWLRQSLHKYCFFPDLNGRCSSRKIKCTFYLFSMFAQKSVYCRCQRRKMKRQQVLESDATLPTTCSLFCEKIDCQPAPSKIHLPFTKDFPLSCCSPTCWELSLSSLAVDQLCLVRSGEIWKISHFAFRRVFVHWWTGSCSWNYPHVEQKEKPTWSWQVQRWRPWHGVHHQEWALPHRHLGLRPACPDSWGQSFDNVHLHEGEALSKLIDIC